MMTKAPGRVITFYSYKGGVGRTFLLANVAALLAEWGHHVLCVDFDLEAPGLNRYLGLDRPHQGLVELIKGFADSDWRDAVQSATGSLESKVRAIRVGRKADGGRFFEGTVDHLGAGRQNRGYASALHGLDWQALYAAGFGARLERWRAEWIAEYDFVLIDSRTGHSDVQGITTAQLPDMLVALFTCNDQSLEGALEVVRLARRQRSALPLDRPRAQVLPIPSRYDAAELPDLEFEWMRRFEATLTPFYDGWRHEAAEPLRLLELLRVDYKSRWSFGEKLPVLSESRSDPANVSHNIAIIAAFIARRLRESDELVENPTGYVEQASQAVRDERSVADPTFEFDVYVSASASDQRAKAIVAELQEDGMRVLMPQARSLSTISQDLPRCEHFVTIQAPSGGDSFQQMELLGFWNEAAASTRRVVQVWRGQRHWMSLDPDLDARVTSIDITGQVSTDAARLLLDALGPRPTAHVSFNLPAPNEDPNPYQTWIKKRHDKVVPFFAAAGELRLAQIYVSLDVSQSIRGDKPERPDRLHIGQTTLLTLLERDDLPHQRWAILGEPGAGKTTLLRHLCRSLAANVDGPVPVFLSLAKHAANRPDPIEAALSEYAGPQPDAVRAALESARDADRIWLFLDGLDEVLPELQEQTRKWIDSLKASRIVVAGRPVSLSQSGIGRDWQSLRVQALNEKQQAELLKNLLGESEGELVWAELAQRPRMRDMARNPLLLTMVAMVGREAGAMGGALPTHRGQLYAAVIDLLLRRGHCPEPRSVRDRRAARTILQRLSLTLHRGGGEAWTRDELSEMLKQLRRGEAEIDQLLRETWDASNEQFLDDVGFNSGVLGPHDGPEEPWRYLHRSQREYLTAEALAEDEAATQQALADLQVEDRRERQRNANRWGETLVLACNLAPEPLTALTALRQADSELALRAVGDVPSLDPDAALAFLFKTSDWTGEHLLALARQWAVQRGDDAAIDRLWPLLSGLQPDFQSARVWYALVQMGDPNVERLRAALQVGAAPELDWVAIRGGTFQMGSPGDVGHPDERPQHAVTLDAFEMTRTTVTGALFNKVFPSRLKSGDATPAVRVSWYEAHLFAALVGARLPTEAEWEYACRAGTTTRWSHGDDEAELGSYAWYDANASETHPVGEKAANLWGLHDMHGNVLEWCADWLGDYPADPQTNPTGPFGGGGRVLRGGTYWSVADGCRSAYRLADHPSRRDDDYGFRLARPQLLRGDH